jgi:hypothetical protein
VILDCEPEELLAKYVLHAADAQHLRFLVGDVSLERELDLAQLKDIAKRLKDRQAGVAGRYEESKQAASEWMLNLAMEASLICGVGADMWPRATLVE